MRNFKTNVKELADSFSSHYYVQDSALCSCVDKIFIYTAAKTFDTQKAEDIPNRGGGHKLTCSPPPSFTFVISFDQKAKF